MTADLVHGGAIDHMRAAFPDAPEPWIDLSTGINPWAYPIDAMEAAVFHHLPDQHAVQTCRQVMAHAFGAAEPSVLVAPGSELIIRLLPDLLPHGNIVIAAPTYGDHGKAWRAAKRDVIERSDPLDNLDGAETVVICNPNNPDGRTWSKEQMERARHILAARGGWLIVDEAYADLRPELSMADRAGADGLIVLRSFGKFFGLAGVRLGALLGPAPLLTAMQEKLGIWSVSGPALTLGARAYRDQVWQEETRAFLRQQRQGLDAVLGEIGFKVVGGTDLFRYVETTDAHGRWRDLARKGLYVRRFDWSTMTLRIGLPPGPDALHRLAALDRE